MQYGCSYNNFLSFNGRKDLTRLSTGCLRIDIMTIQDNWRFCRRCKGLAYSGHGRVANCPAGGPAPDSGIFGSDKHDLDFNSNYALIFNTQVVDGQDHWNYCGKCEGLAYFNEAAGHPAKNCTEGGLHSFENSANYVLMGYIEKQQPVPGPH